MDEKESPGNEQNLTMQNFKVEVIGTEDYPHLVKEEFHSYVEGDIEKTLVPKYECDINDKIYGEDHNLDNHVKEYHWNDRNLLSVASSQRQDGVKLYNCEHPQCGRSFANLSKLSEHILVHSDKRPLKCDHPGCTKTFKRKYDVSVHMRVHSVETPFKCNYQGCNKAFKAKTLLKTHSRIHCNENEFKCTIEECGKIFNSSSSLKSHETRHSDERPFKCSVEFCGKTFKRKRYLQNHERRHYSKIRSPKLLKCEKPCCNLKFKSNCPNESHGEGLEACSKYYTINSFKCKEAGCNKSFPNKRRLYIHKRVHRSTKPFRCNRQNCRQAFKYKRSLKLHLETHGYDSPLKYKHRGWKRSFKIQDYLQNHRKVLRKRCAFGSCSASYRTIDQLAHHMRSHKEQELSCSSTDSNSTKMFRNNDSTNITPESSLKQHGESFGEEKLCSQGSCEIQRNEEELYACGYTNCGGVSNILEGCNAASKENEQLEYHKRAQTSCIGKNNLESRLNRKVSIQKRFDCEECGCTKSFKSKHSLLNHMRVHNSYKQFKCSYNGCFRAFGRKHSLKEHMRLHSYETNFRCNHKRCGQEFKTKYQLNYHEKSHNSTNPSSGEKRVCEYPGCPATFNKRNRASYYCHRQVHKIGNRYPCTHQQCLATFCEIEDLKNHITNHTVEKFLCSFEGCYRSFSKEGDLISHLNSSSNVHDPTSGYNVSRPYKCEENGCTKSFRRKVDLKVHKLVHCTEKEFKCSYKDCRGAFKTKGNLKTHMLLHSNESRFKCSYRGCDKAFKQKGYLKNHEKTHLASSDSDQTVKCDFPGCKLTFKLKNTYYAHRRKHRAGKRYPCTIDGCDVAFHDIRDLKNHFEDHDVEKEGCDQKLFSSSEDSISYQETYHAKRVYSSTHDYGNETLEGTCNNSLSHQKVEESFDIKDMPPRPCFEQFNEFINVHQCTICEESFVEENVFKEHVYSCGKYSNFEFVEVNQMEANCVTVDVKQEIENMY